MIKVAITGGIGSGKTYISDLFNKLYGIPVYNCDENAKKILASNLDLQQELINNFSNKIIDSSSDKVKIDRNFFFDNILTSESDLLLLNIIYHPYILKDFNNWIENQTSKYTLFESAILFETGSNKYFDYVINVDAPENLKIFRILNRTNWNLEKIKLIMDNQLGEIFKRSNSNFTIMNDEIENVENIITEINKILLT